MTNGRIVIGALTDNMANPERSVRPRHTLTRNQPSRLFPIQGCPHGAELPTRGSRGPGTLRQRLRAPAARDGGRGAAHVRLQRLVSRAGCWLSTILGMMRSRDPRTVPRGVQHALPVVALGR